MPIVVSLFLLLDNTTFTSTRVQSQVFLILDLNGMYLSPPRCDSEAVTNGSFLDRRLECRTSHVPLSPLIGDRLIP